MFWLLIDIDQRGKGYPRRCKASGPASALFANSVDVYAAVSNVSAILLHIFTSPTFMITSGAAVLSAPRTLAAGESEFVYVEWSPRHNVPADARYRANLTVLRDGGNSTLELIGDPRAEP